VVQWKEKWGSDLLSRRDCPVNSRTAPAGVKPQTGEVISDNADGIACWFVDTDYNEENFFVRHAYFLGANDPYSALKTTLKAEIDPEAWATLHSDTSRPFTGRAIAHDKRPANPGREAHRGRETCRGGF
jgi:hypothetical protein